MSELPVWVGLGVSLGWLARCLQVGCGRMVPVAGVLAGLFALATPPGQALQAALAEMLIVGSRIVAWMAGPLLAAAALAWLMRLLGRRPTRPGSLGRRVTVPMVAVLGVTAALLVAPMVYPAVDAVVGAGADGAWWAAVRVVGSDTASAWDASRSKLPWAPSEVAATQGGAG